ncbi:MAG: DNA repair protein RecO [Flavobacteriaceae bacterium]
MKTKALVINTVKYQDKSLIVKCFTLSDGLVSFFVKDAFSASKSSVKKAAYFQPLTLLEIEFRPKNRNTLSYFSSIKPYIYQSVATDIAKSTVILFLAEVFHSCIKDETKNEDLFLFLETALLWLDQNDDIADFHLILLLEMTKFLGFYPSASKDDFFEMTDGVFVSLESKSCLSKPDSDLLKQLLGKKINTSGKAFSNSQRRQLLEILMEYYFVHIENFRKPKSLEVLKEVFSN